MAEEMRLKLEQTEEDRSIKSVLEKLDVAVHVVNGWKQNMSNVDGRGLSIAITHIETACLWIKESVKTED